MFRTIDDLLSDLTEQINFADPERFRYRVADHVRTVFRRIGYDLIATPYTEHFEVVAHELRLPPYVLKVDDLSLDGYTMEGYQVEADMQPGAYLAYRVTPSGIHLPNMQYGKIWVKFFGLPKDKHGQYFIPIEAYEGVYEYTLGKLLEGQFQHPRYAERYALQDRADRLIAEARVELRPDSAARRRAERHSTGLHRIINDNFMHW